MLKYILMLLISTSTSFAQWNIIYDTYYHSSSKGITINNEGEYLIASTIKNSSNSSYTASVHKLTQLGSEIYLKCISDTTKNISVQDIDKVEDEKYVISAFNIDTRDYIFYKIDSEANLLWEKTFNDTGSFFYVTDFKLLENGNYLITSHTDSHCGHSDQKFFICNIDGDVIWSSLIHSEMLSTMSPKTFINAVGNLVSFASIKEDGSDFFKIGCREISFDSNILTEKILFTEGHHHELYDVTKIASGGYVLTGRINNMYGNHSGWFIIKVNDLLEEVWWKNYYDDSEIKHSVSTSIIETSDSCLVITGERNQYLDQNNFDIFYSDYAVTKFTSEGEIIWEVLLPGFGLIKRAYSVVETIDNNFVTVGYTDGTWEGFDAFILAIDKDGNHNVGIDNDNYELAITNYELKQNYPNPFNPVTKISYGLAVNSDHQIAEIVVYNAMGQEVWSSKPLSLNTNHCTFDGSKFNSGVYYYSLIVDGKKMDTKAMILIK